MVSSGGGGGGGTCPSQETRWLCVATLQKGARRRSCTLRIWRLLPILHTRRVMNGGVLVIRDRPRCHFAAAERTRKITVASPGRPLLADDSGVLLFLMLMFLMLLSSTCNKPLAVFFFSILMIISWAGCLRNVLFSLLLSLFVVSHSQRF